MTMQSTEARIDVGHCHCWRTWKGGSGDIFTWTTEDNIHVSAFAEYSARALIVANKRMTMSQMTWQ